MEGGSESDTFSDRDRGSDGDIDKSMDRDRDRGRCRCRDILGAGTQRATGKGTRIGGGVRTGTCIRIETEA